MVEDENMNKQIMLDDLDQNSRAILEGVVRRVTFRPETIIGQSVIDVGCGEGRLLERLLQGGVQQLAGIGWAARMQTGVAIFNGVDLCQSGWAARLDGRVYDWVVSTEVLEHLVNPYQYLKEVRQLVSPKGKLVLTFPNVHNLRSIIGYALKGRFSGFFGPNFNQNHPLHDQHIFIPNMHLVRYLLYLAGFTDLKISYLNGIGRLFSQTTLLEATPCAPIQLPE
jgi:SAM-dependent methyltransferase